MSTSEEFNERGIALFMQGKLDDAAACFRQALEINPTYANAHNNLGNTLKELGLPIEAMACYRQALRIDPNHANALNNLGLVFFGQGEFAQAAECFSQALRVSPNYVNAHNNLGRALHSQGQHAQAMACFHRVLLLNPNHVDAHINLGNAYQEQQQWAQAADCFRQALRINPANADAHYNMGNALREKGRFGETIIAYRDAIRLQPGNEKAHVNLGMLLLHQGDFEEGWVEYEWRRRLKRSAVRSFPQPLWDGSSLNGKTILLHAEQGLGDTLQFIRYAPLVKQRGGQVLFDCPPELVRVMQGCAGIDHILTPGAPLPPVDCQAPLLSLPLIMKTTLGSVPASIPYLSADAALTERWRQDLSCYAGFKIGIVWQGNPRFSQPECRAADQRRSIPLAQFEPLARLPGVRLFSLQKGYGTEQLTEWKARWDIVDLGDSLRDFMDTAALLMNLDLLISADTSPIHLAGALGRPVWAVLPSAGCWRWLQDRDDSPWYPGMRLFRQQRAGDWGEVFERIAEEIRRLYVS